MSDEPVDMKGLVKVYFELLKASPSRGIIDNINVLVSVLESRGFKVTFLVDEPEVGGVLK